MWQQNLITSLKWIQKKGTWPVRKIKSKKERKENLKMLGRKM